MLNNKLVRFALPVIVICGMTWVAAINASDGGDARRAQIVANLQLAYEQLAGAKVEVTELTASEFEGLDQGVFTVNGKPQNFLLSTDNTKFYFTNGPIDVSRSAAEIEVARSEKAAEAAKVAASRRQQLESSTAGLPIRGNPDAPITIIEFSDFQCPYCGRGAQTVEALLEKYPEDIKFVFKHFPLGFHPWAKPAAIAAHCAGEQDDDAFWTIHDKYFEEQKKITPGNVIVKSREFLEGSGIDLDAWMTCAKDTNSETYKAAAALVDADLALGKSMGVSGTPGFFVNGRFLNGAQPPAAFEPLIAEARNDS